MASLYKDLFVDGNTLQGWDLNTVPLIFPNVIVFSLFNFITGNYQVAYLIHGILQYFSIILIINYLFVTINKNVSKIVLASTNLLLGLFLISFMVYDEAHIFALFLLPYHTGSFIITLLCLIWLLKYIDNGKKKYLVLIFIISFLTIISDKIFIAYFSISTFTTMVLLLFYEQYSRKRILLSIATIAFSCVFSMGILKIILHTHYISFFETKLVVQSRIASSFQLMIEQYYAYLKENSLKGILFKLSIIVLLLLFIKIYSIHKKRKQLSENNLSYILILFSSIFVVGIWLSPAINGIYLGYDCIRYNFWVVVLLITLFPFLLNFQFNNKLVNTTLFCLLVISLTIGMLKINNIKNSNYSLKSYIKY
jgi:hypothetical protein